MPEIIVILKSVYELNVFCYFLRMRLNIFLRHYSRTELESQHLVSHLSQDGIHPGLIPGQIVLKDPAVLLLLFRILRKCPAENIPSHRLKKRLKASCVISRFV